VAAGLMLAVAPMASMASMVSATSAGSPATMCADARAVPRDCGFVADLAGI